MLRVPMYNLQEVVLSILEDHEYAFGLQDDLNKRDDVLM